MSNNVELNIRSGPDSLLVEIAEYVSKQDINSELALSTARNCLIDTIGCGLLALTFPACTKMLGPIVPEQWDQAFLCMQEKLMLITHNQ